MTQRTDLLVDRVEQATDTILSRFQNIVDLSSTDDGERSEHTDPSFIAATQSAQVEHSAGQIVRAAQDLRIILREVREHWILGAKIGRSQNASNESKDDDAMKNKLQQAIAYLGRTQHAASSGTSDTTKVTPT